MFSVLSKVYDYFSYDVEKSKCEKKLEEELRKLEEEERKETLLGVTKPVTPKPGEISGQNCFKKQGTITSLQNDHGIIDQTLLFDISATSKVQELRVGFQVQYLAYKAPDSDYIKVIRIEQILNDYWDVPTEQNDIVARVELEKLNPEFFNTHQRSFLGQVVSRNENFITVDTDYDKVDIDLDTVTVDFVLQLGDQVYLTCNVQTDQTFVDSTGEILEVVSIHAARSKKVKGSITAAYADNGWGHVNNEFHFTFDVLPSNYIPQKDDRVNVEVIESDRGKYFWRCTSMFVIERVSQRNKEVKIDANDRILDNKNGISVTDNFAFRFQNMHETKEGTLTIKNESDSLHKITKVCFLGKKSRSQLQLMGYNMNDQFVLNSGESKTIQLQAKAACLGYSKEVILINFENFKIAREIEIEVGERVTNGGSKIQQNGQREKKTERYHRKNPSYALQVWSKKTHFIPGVHTCEKPKFVANRIGIFEVPERLRNVVLMEANQNEMKGGVEDLYPCLAEGLTYQNYCTRFQVLLHLEEIEYFLSIRQYDRERGHFSRDGEFLVLEIENLSEKRPSLMLGDSIRITNPWAESDDKRCYEGIIHKVLFNRIQLKFNCGFHAKYNGEDYRIEFYFSRFSFRKQHYAIRKAYHQMGSQFLFPSKIQLQDSPQLEVSLNENLNLAIKDRTGEIKWFNESLNDVQKKAIKNVLRGDARPMPYVIFGPPGTGKTLTLVETILQLITLLPDSRLLVATPSNSSADLIATRLISCDAIKPGDFVRLVSQNLIEKDLIPDHLKQYCATVDIAKEGTSKDGMIVTESGLKLKCQIKHIGRHRITIGTCITLGSLLQMGFAKGHFTHVLIDEAGQCIESEAMIPITFLDQFTGQVVLAGDPMQLGPIVLNTFAIEKDLGVSFLQRILDRMPYNKDFQRFPETGFDPRLITKLIYNYRALPSILKIYNDLFYDSELRPMIDENKSREIDVLRSIQEIIPPDPDRSPTHGVFFVGIRADNKQDSDSPSWYNPAEAKSIFLFVIKLYKLKVNPKDIGIITPYQKQVRAIRNIFIEADICLPKIGSVEEFQGQERDIILISTVRSRKSLIEIDLIHSLGFVRSDKRLNVAISRARSLLMIFGNPHLLRLDKNWEALIKYCIANDAYTGCDLPSQLM